MNTYVLPLQDLDRSKFMIAGGKGANLGELSGIKGIQVPDGFCVTTKAYERIIANNPISDSLLDELAQGKADVCTQIRSLIERIPVPADIAAEIREHLAKFADNTAFAVRSSATAEDLPTASFAGQQDTYLNIIGETAVLQHISRCWASLFSERAVIYRQQHGFDHRSIQLSVIVQQMVFPQAAGILFTADPVTANRKVLSVDASFGLGEAIVSGLVNTDLYKVCNGKIIDKKIAQKKVAVYAVANGGTKEQSIEAVQQNSPALTDDQILTLAGIGRTIEAHFGSPQDIEWCLADDIFYIVQSRPITTLFPIPEADDLENHVYVSVGHQQMMTDPIKPLGLSFYLLITRAPMRSAGGRLYVDVTAMLSSPGSRKDVIDKLGKSDPIIGDALLSIAAREGFIKLSDDKETKLISPEGFRTQIDADPGIVADLIQWNQASVEALKQNIQTKSGTDLFDFILEDMLILKQHLFNPQSTKVIMAAMDASSWLNEKMNEWLGEKNAADTLSQSVANNVTSEMGLALLDVADVIRPYAAIVDHLPQIQDLNELLQFDGGKDCLDAISAYLNKYGMRCTGEIDITKTRWSEKPLALVPLILNNIKNFSADAASRKFEQGRQEALDKEASLLARLKQLPAGEEKVLETKRMIRLVRDFIGYREYPKYGMINRLFVYKQALLKEAERLSIFHEKEDIYYFSFEELREIVRSNQVDYDIINKRKEAYRLYEKLNPPRVMTSDGEIISAAYKRENLPLAAIPGLPVSSGVIEGRARVILKMEDASLEDGDILVTAFTDPGWTALFVSIKGLVTEVGGLMTHGAVIAREYGLPAVVGVEHATKLIKDGQRIRVNGTDGYVEIL